MKPNFSTLPATPPAHSLIHWTMVVPVISTMHLPEFVFNDLSEHMGSAFMGELDCECGALLSVDTDDIDEETPPELAHLLRYLAARNYEYVRLDNCGNDYADLPAWHWETGEPIEWETPHHELAA
jgi:hypothetical protein